MTNIEQFSSKAYVVTIEPPIFLAIGRMGPIVASFLYPYFVE